MAAGMISILGIGATAVAWTLSPALGILAAGLTLVIVVCYD